MATLEHHHVPYVTGMTWTTDALYRETRGKVGAAGRRGVPHGGDGGRGVLRGRGVPGRHVRPTAVRRATTCPATRGTSAAGTSTPTAAELMFRLAAEAVLRLPPG